MPPRKPTGTPDTDVQDYRYDATRKNFPPAGLASQGKAKEAPRQRYAYNPHLPPVLRFDETGAADRLPELLEQSLTRPLTAEEARLLVAALRGHEPWALSGTSSLPFPAGRHRRVAVKVIDPHGNEVISAHRLAPQY